MQQNIFVLTGPTGAGKTTIAHYLQDKYKMSNVITHTTREPRIGEINKKDYYFESNESFLNNHYLEQVKYANNYYGSSYEALNLAWKINDNATIVLDTKGAKTYADKLKKQAIIVFVTVSNSDILVKRLENRGDDQKSIEKRLSSDDFKRDLIVPKLSQPVHVIINDDLNVALKKVDELVLKTL